LEEDKVSEQIKLDRSYVRNSSMAIAVAVTIIAAVTLAMSGLAEAQSSRENVPSSNGSFGPIKQIDAGLLNVGYAEAGPSDGTPVILLHGWPYDIYSYVNVAPLLASKRNSRASMRTGISREASGIICPKKLRKPLPRPSLMSTPSIGARRNRNGGHDREATFI
jgi:hypothetical protein